MIRRSTWCKPRRRRAAVVARRPQRRAGLRLGLRPTCWPWPACSAAKSLRQALADAGQPVAARAGIATSLFGGRSPPSRRRCSPTSSSARWSSGDDLVDAVEDLGAQAVFIVAERKGSLERVEGELFRFGRAVDASPELQLALDRPGAAAASASRRWSPTCVAARAAPGATALLDLPGRQPARRRPVDAVEAADRARRRPAPPRGGRGAQRDRADPRAAEPAGRRAHPHLRSRGATCNVIVDPAVLGGVSSASTTRSSTAPSPTARTGPTAVIG